MTNGTGSILKLHPTGYAALDFNAGVAPTGADTYTFTADLGRLRLNEEDRVAWDYEQNALGGSATQPKTGLVSVVFPVIVKALTSVARRTAYRALLQAVTNRRGGKLEYKPEGASISTFYHYVASGAPSLIQDPRNRWDSGPTSDGLYTLAVEVELQTQPVATSDPDNPVALTELSTRVANWKDATRDNRVTIPKESIKGTLPALLRLTATPVSALYRLGRFIISHRTSEDGLLANVVSVYEAEDAEPIYPSSSWSSQSDADRGDGGYLTCNPSSHLYEQGLRFTIRNPADGEGRFAVFGVVRDLSAPGEGYTGRWTHRVELRTGNVTQSGETYEAATKKSWQLVYVGEFDLPATELSSATTGYDDGPHLDWYSRRGPTNFNSPRMELDGLILVWLRGKDILGSGTALDVCCGDEGGVIAGESLLIENFPDESGRIVERSYVVDAATGDFVRVLMTAPRGDFLTLDPACDHLLTVFHELFNGNVFQDNLDEMALGQQIVLADFGSESGLYSIDALGDLVSAVASSPWVTLHVFNPELTGVQKALVGYMSLALAPYDGALPVYGQTNHTLHPMLADLLEAGCPLVESDDWYACIAIYADVAGDVGVKLRFGSDWDSCETDYYEYDAGTVSLSAGYNSIRAPKSAFTKTGTATWSSLVFWCVVLDRDAGNQNTLYLDYVRIEAGDPTAGAPDVSGGAWAFYPNDRWALTEDMATGDATLACLATEPGDRNVAEIVSTNFSAYFTRARFRARVASRTADGVVGIYWRGEMTQGSHSFAHIARLDFDAEELQVGYFSGSWITRDTVSVSGIQANFGDFYTLGVIAYDDFHEVYMAKSEELESDDDVFGMDHLKTVVEDNNNPTGGFGVISENQQGRFCAMSLEYTEDKVIPDNKLDLTGAAIFRTTVPFE